jgi:hypothetical protein
MDAFEVMSQMKSDHANESGNKTRDFLWKPAAAVRQARKRMAPMRRMRRFQLVRRGHDFAFSRKLPQATFLNF